MTIVSPQVIHGGTQITATFGLVDDEGNAIPQEPIVISVVRFSEDAFIRAFHAICEQRDRALAGIEAERSSIAPDGTVGAKGARAARRGRKPSSADR